MSHPPRRRSDTLALHGGSRVRATPLPYARQTIEADDIAAVAPPSPRTGSRRARRSRASSGPWPRARAPRYAVAFSNGTAALHAACFAAGLGPGDEAITTPLTFAATANAVVYQGARPIFADIDGVDAEPRADAVKRVATSQTRAAAAGRLRGAAVRLRPPDGARARARLDRHRGRGALARRRLAIGRWARSRTDDAVLPSREAHHDRGGWRRAHRSRRPHRAAAARCATTASATPTGRGRGTTRSTSPATTTGSPTSSRRSGSVQLGKLERFWSTRDRLARRYRERLAGSPLRRAARAARRAGVTAGTSSSCSCAWSASRWTATRSSRRCGPRTSGRPFTIRSSTVTRSIESGSATAAGLCATAERRRGAAGRRCRSSRR